MGVDFIRQRAKSFRKLWDRHRLELTTKDLFSREPDCITRGAVARVLGSDRVEEGTPLLLVVQGETLVAMREMRPVAVLVRPPASLLTLIEESGGYADGRVEGPSPAANLIQITIC
jgi:hypothetical protein